MTLSVFPILSAVLLTLFLPHAHSQGLTLDRCRFQANCIGPRQCLDIETLEPCPRVAFLPKCRCIPPSRTECLSDRVCPEGEVCAARRGEKRNTRFSCASEVVVDDEDDFFRATQPNLVQGGLTADRCRRNSDCLVPRICIRSIFDSTPGACVGFPNCFCVPPTFIACETDGDCPPGEVCGLGDIDICASRNVTSGRPRKFPNPTQVADPENVQNILDNPIGSPLSSPPEVAETPEVIIVTREVCVAEKHMNGIKGIYETGRLARVLCDIHGSCATPGHLVVFREKSMMMRRYCDVVGCSERVMKVNSPAWERGLKVESWSDGLTFTAFAARYETLAEEVLLRGLIRAGL